MGLSEDLQKAAAALKQVNPSSIAGKAGSELFVCYCSGILSQSTRDEREGIEVLKKKLISILSSKTITPTIVQDPCSQLRAAAVMLCFAIFCLPVRKRLKVLSTTVPLSLALSLPALLCSGANNLKRHPSGHGAQVGSSVQGVYFLLSLIVHSSYAAWQGRRSGVLPPPIYTANPSTATCAVSVRPFRFSNDGT
eukprot:1145852-Pelagomonas_calceolata.AAC.5